jgi:RNA polymerase sigma-70 factor (ECF subfamily)
MPDDKKALVERLFAAHRNALVAFFQRRVRARSDAPDLAQEVYLRMMRVRDIETIENPEAYLFTVAGNLVKEHAARQRRHGTEIDVEDVAVQGQLAELPTMDRQLDTAQRVRRLSEVLRQLPPKGQAAIVLQYVHGCTYQEIGARLNISPSMVKKYLTQGLELCRRRMRRLG